MVIDLVVRIRRGLSFDPFGSRNVSPSSLKRGVVSLEQSLERHGSCAKSSSREPSRLNTSLIMVPMRSGCVELAPVLIVSGEVDDVGGGMTLTELHSKTCAVGLGRLGVGYALDDP